MSEPTRQQKCADLARAMGIPESEWPHKCFAEKHQMDNDGGNAWCYMCEMMADNSERVPPNPYESADDKDALLAWLAADQRRWERFAFKLFEYLGIWDGSFKLTDIAKATMTAPLPVIADAAWLALKDNHTSQPSL